VILASKTAISKILIYLSLFKGGIYLFSDSGNNT